MTQRDNPNKRIQRRRYRRIRRDDELIDALLADTQNTDPVLREQLEQMKRERDQAAFYEAEQKRQMQDGAGYGIIDPVTGMATQHGGTLSDSAKSVVQYLVLTYGLPAVNNWLRVHFAWPPRPAAAGNSFIVMAVISVS